MPSLTEVIDMQAVQVEIVTVEGGVIARPLGQVDPIDDETVRKVLESIRR